MGCTRCEHYEGFPPPRLEFPHVLPYTRRFQQHRDEINAWLGSDEARGRYCFFWQRDLPVLGFSDAGTAFAFKMKFG